jgi:hypothetical protein
LSFSFGSREDPAVVFSPRQVAVVALAVVACSHSVRYPGVTWRPPSGDNEGNGTFVMQRGALRSLELEVLRVSGRPDTDECALLFGSCQDGRPAAHQFLVTTTAEQQRGCMVPYCGSRIDDLLKISWGREVPRIALQQAGVLVRGREGDFHESKLEAAIEKLISGKDRPVLVIIDASCRDPVDATLRAVALIKEKAKVSVLLTMVRNNPDESCDDPRDPPVWKGK